MRKNINCLTQIYADLTQILADVLICDYPRAFLAVICVQKVVLKAL